MHANGGIAAAAIGVQPDMHVLQLIYSRLIQHVMQALRRDLVAEPHFIVDIAVQIDLPHRASPLRSVVLVADMLGV